MLSSGQERTFVNIMNYRSQRRYIDVDACIVKVEEASLDSVDAAHLDPEMVAEVTEEEEVADHFTIDSAALEGPSMVAEAAQCRYKLSC
jgi:hypothetical protein